MSELNEHLQLTHLYCYSIIHCNSGIFRYHKYKVIDDREFLINLILNNKIKELDYMEEFYKELLSIRTCEKDIMSRNYCTSLSNFKGDDEEQILDFNELKPKFKRKRS